MKKLFRRLILIFILILCFYLIPTRDLNVNAKSQYPSMPNGCEVTSLSMLMSYNGFSVNKEYLNDNFLKKSNLNNADPNEAYIGSPYKNGYYCYAKPLENCANDFFKSNGVNKRAIDKTGISIFGLLNNIIFHKRPVAVWITVDDKSPEYSNVYYTNPLGTKVPLYNNLHCVILKGVGKGNVFIVDPIKGERKMNILLFTKLFYEMKQRALIIE